MPEAGKSSSAMDEVKQRLAREAEMINTAMQARKDREQSGKGRPARGHTAVARGRDFRKFTSRSNLMVIGLVLLIGIAAAIISQQYRKYHPDQAAIPVAESVEDFQLRMMPLNILLPEGQGYSVDGEVPAGRPPLPVNPGNDR